VAPEFSRELMAAVELGARFIVIDLGQATFIDSTALRVLMQGRARFEACGGSMSILCPDKKLWKIFEITGLTELFPRYWTVEEARSVESAKPSPDQADVPVTPISPVP
jgi:anti-sigma B factor antagonist